MTRCCHGRSASSASPFSILHSSQIRLVFVVRWPNLGAFFLVGVLLTAKPTNYLTTSQPICTSSFPSLPFISSSLPLSLHVPRSISDVNPSIHRTNLDSHLPPATCHLPPLLVIGGCWNPPGLLRSLVLSESPSGPVHLQPFPLFLIFHLPSSIPPSAFLSLAPLSTSPTHPPSNLPLGISSLGCHGTSDKPPVAPFLLSALSRSD